MKYNDKIRRKARGEGVSLWEVAVFLGISEPTITRWLRTPLSPEKENRIMEAISTLSREQEDTPCK